MMRNPGFILTACLLILGCSDVKDSSSTDRSSNSTADKKPMVVVTSQPLYEVADLLAGDLIEVQKVTPDNIASRNWKPQKDDVKRLQNADLILISGAGYEPWKDRVSLPGSRLKDTAAGYYSQFIRIPDAITHQHGPEGKHAHPGTVWATWLDPELAESQCSSVAKLIEELQPEHTKTISDAMSKIAIQLRKSQDLAAEITARTSTQKFTIVGDNPHYHYLTNRLGWTFQYVHWDESQELTPIAKDELTKLVDKLPKDQPRFFLLNSRQPESTATFATEAGFTVIRIDLCEYPVQDSSNSVFERLYSNYLHLQRAVESP